MFFIFFCFPDRFLEFHQIRKNWRRFFCVHFQIKPVISTMNFSVIRRNPYFRTEKQMKTQCFSIRHWKSLKTIVFSMVFALQACKTIVFSKNTDLLFGRLDDFFEKAIAAFKELSEDIKHAEPEELFLNATEFKAQLANFMLITSGGSMLSTTQENIVFHTKHQRNRFE